MGSESFSCAVFGRILALNQMERTAIAAPAGDVSRIAA
jgi:hypothetical protein